MSRARRHRSAKSSTKGRRSASAVVIPFAPSSRDNYRVGPGNPPKEYQYKKGQSGNPLGAKLVDDFIEEYLVERKAQRQRTG